MNVEVLLQLIAMLAPLSLVAVGGALTIMPEIHRQVVEVYGWLSSAEFAELFTVAQTAPGDPHVLFASVEQGALLHSTDGGVRWTRVDSPLSDDAHQFTVLHRDGHLVRIGPAWTLHAIEGAV